MKRFVLIFSSLLICVAIVLSLCIFSIGAYFGTSDVFELDEELFDSSKRDSAISYIAFDNSGNEIEVYRSYTDIRRDWVSFSDISDYLKAGFISAEDRRFYSHSGVNIKRTLAAGVNYLIGKDKKFGASTITQQVIKNISGDNEKSLKRKFTEIIRALHLERGHTKEEIFEVYLNIVPMTGNICGVSRAAEQYFGKSADSLNLHEAATIVGITNSPSLYNPYNHPDACLDKRNRVLFAMLDNGEITDTEYKEAISAPLSVLDRQRYTSVESWFIESANDDVISDLVSRYSITQSAARMLMRGTKVYLTVNPEIQKILEDYFYCSANFPDEIKDGLEFAMTVIDNRTGNLVATVGGAGRKSANRVLNMAQTPIIPASTIKPLSIYAPLIDSGVINWATVIDDTPTEINEHNGDVVAYPRNSPNVYSGLLTVSDAIRLSKNTSAVKLLSLLGLDNAYSRLSQDFGFRLVDNRHTEGGVILTDRDVAPLALGQLTDGVTLRELTRAYTAFSRYGVLSTARTYYAVYKSDGTPLIESPYMEKRVYSTATAEIMNQLLMRVVDNGTASSVTLKNTIDTAGKTGTSSGNRDKLFIGYTPYYTAGIWCGYTERSKGVSGIQPSHVRIWDEIMTRIHSKTLSENNEYASFSLSQLKLMPYCRDSGCKPNGLCRHDLRGSRVEYGYFARSSIPEATCQRHIAVDMIPSALREKYAVKEYDDIPLVMLLYSRPLYKGITISDEDLIFDPEKIEE